MTDSNLAGVPQSGSTAASRTASRRSPVYADFEQLNAEDAAKETDYWDESDTATLVEELEKTLTTFEEGQIVKGSITEIRENEIIVDVGFKSEGTISVNEFRDFDQINKGDQTSFSRSSRTRTDSSFCRRRRPTSSRSGTRSKTAMTRAASCRAA